MREQERQSMTGKGKRLMRALLHLSLLALFLLRTGSALGGNETAIAQLDECALENGQRIVDCRVAYRTFGKLNSEKTNVVLMPTWYNGSSADLATYATSVPEKSSTATTTTSLLWMHLATACPHLPLITNCQRVQNFRPSPFAIWFMPSTAC